MPYAKREDENAWARTADPMASHNWTHLSAEEISSIAAMKRDGMTLIAIARKLGRGYTPVRRHARRLAVVGGIAP